MSAPINIESGFIKDEISKMCEPVQGRSFLYTGKKPLVGQRTETQVRAGGVSCRLSGVVTAVGPLPNFDQ